MKHVYLTMFLLLSLSSAANIAQPGIYRAGGGSGFTLLFPEDSTAFDKVRMERELVSIQIYPGFAVVKGEYSLRNLSDSSLNFHLGYPVNHIIESDSRQRDMASVWYPQFYGLTVYQGAEQQPVRLDSSLRYKAISRYDRLDWYVWETTFEPKEEQTILVYFLANTNEAVVLQEYDKNKDQIFMYLLESGAVWNGPIGTGEIRLQGKDGIILSASQRMYTALPAMFHPQSKSIVARFSALNPTPKHNFIIRGSEWTKPFDFADILSRRDHLYEELDRFSFTELPKELTESVEQQDPFVVTNHLTTWFMGLAMIAGVMAPYILGGGLLLLIGYRLFKRMSS